MTYFARIAEDGSLTRAAGVLRIAQPALSRQMRLLEDELGVRLFSRTARGMRLTEEGEYLRAAAAGPLRELELALQNVRGLGGGLRGNFAIGMPPGIGEILARPLLLRLRAHYPEIRLRMVEGPTGSLTDWANRGVIDFALLEDASGSDRLAVTELLAAELLLVGASDGGLDLDVPVDFAAVAQLPLILPSHHLGMRATIDRAAARAGKTLCVALEADSPRLIRALVAGGEGYAILPRPFVEADRLAGQLRIAPIAPSLPWRILLASRPRAGSERPENAVAETVAAVLAEVAV